MKRLLIITYYWPPSGGSGVQRWLKFAKYLPQFDWQPVVYTPDNPDFAVKDKSLLKDIPPSLELLKYQINEPYSLFRKLLGKKEKDSNAGIVNKNGSGIINYIANFIRGNVFIPDPKVSWVKPSIKHLIAYINENEIDCIVTTGPPHSMHLIGLGLKKETNIPWIADFRDPWSELDMLENYHILNFRFNKYRALEKRVLNQADLTMTVSKIWEKDFTRLGAKKTTVVTNGFDSADFKGDVVPYNDFVIAHFGLLNHLRDPKNLWKSLASLCSENEDFNKKLKLHFGGTVDKSVINEIKSFSILTDKIKVFPYLSHEEVIGEYKKSGLLLLLLFNSDSGIGNIPGKLFEYLATNKPILAFGRKGGDSEGIVNSGSKNKFLDYDESYELELKSFLAESFQLWTTIDAESIEDDYSIYSRENLTKELVSHLNELT